MKRVITLVAVAAASLLMAVRAHAQFGIVGGITSSTTDMTTAPAANFLIIEVFLSATGSGLLLFRE